MKDILFTHSYFLRFDAKQWALGQPYAPLGTLYAASLMRENGYQVAVFDTMFAKSAEEVMPALDEHQPQFFVIYDDGFNYLTKMCLTNMREAAFKMIKLAKERGCTVLVSSSDSTDQYVNYLNQGADIIMLGEAEYTLLETIAAIKQGKEIGQVHGIAFKKNNEIIKTSRRSVIKDLDSLPLPAWDIIDIAPYKSSWTKSVGYFSMNIGTTRGCPFKCNWCAKPIYGNRYNSRSPQNVITELKMLKENYEYDHIWFCDDIFGLKPGWVHEFADLTVKENLHLKFKIQSRADLLLQENNIEDLARAGCDNIWIGAESGSQKILDAMDKGITIDQISKAAGLLKKHGIKPSFFIQFGYPGETWEDIQSTIDMINRLLPYSIGVSVSYPLPGTVFHERVLSELKEKTNWTDSDELQLMFKNTYQPAFYKQLHRYVQHNYRKHLAMEQLKKMLRGSVRISKTAARKVLSLLYYMPVVALDHYKLNKLEQTRG
ncbi:MAG: B12-binding domain-containing radical SAM protein [Taibaiella sp.]|nr:B12-binding domain-containing radical SAM protein [Taibaiella sp.]